MAHVAAMGVSQISSSIYVPELPLKSQNPQPSSLFLKGIRVAHKRFNLVRASVDGSPTPGLYSAKQFELTPENVDMVLEDVRPYLISDGGNVDVVSVEDGVVSLQLQGACESCPSSTTTMKMGIERVLKEKFGEAIKEIRQVYDQQVVDTTAEAVNAHLDILRPAIKNFGGSVEVLSVEEGNCNVKYVGPESIGSGIKAAIKEKFPDIVNVVFTD
ncbi:NifU-like protein 1, chloroplastic [Datura stramonium]|uniref:NifU-like protein 1, chloroplastic n=1 Tax=Datura stramonium TaxID=4076 RepID=A0ABS8VD97_DATST|nr:NifU-like protein 1, chloroplastic [Datura stramonium]